MFKDVIKILKQHSYIERRQVNAYHEIKASLSENDLMLRVDFGKSFQQDAIQQMASKMPHKVHISEINVLAYLQRVSMLKDLIIIMFEMIMLSLLPKVRTTIESRLQVACKKLSTRSNIFLQKRTILFMFEVMEWGYNLV